MTGLSFGEWLKRRRGAEGWTQKQLAQKISCSISALRKMEAEERRPSTQVIEQLAELFAIPKEERKSFLRFARGDWQAFESATIDDAPWRASKMAHPSSLPTPITSFIGREKEQDQVIDLLNKYRLVTLTGSGGVGKTRLALKIGGRVLEKYAGGIWQVELAALNDPALLPQTITRVLGIANQSETGLTEILINFLRTKTSLIILDNCEHLLDACAQLADILLKNCPNLKILATSREQLGITGEAVYRVPSLGLAQVEPKLEEFWEFESARLFEDRAQLVQTGFSLTPENAVFVDKICARLDGIPLAIELAAAKVGLFSTKEIAERLETSFNLLTGGGRTDLPRQQTIRASFDWSWNLLTEAEQGFMQQLSVFSGGWALKAAQAVCNGDVLSLTNSLVKKSLIVVKQEAVSETRYNFHEVIRQYAHEKLVEAGEEENIRNRHLEYFRELAKQARPHLRNANQLIWLDRLETEIANIRAALVWAGSGGSMQAGLDLAADLGHFWFYRTDVKQNRLYVEKLLAMPEALVDKRTKAKGLQVAGFLAYFAGVPVMARTRLAESEMLWQELEETDKAGLAETRDMLIDLDFYFDHNLDLVRRRYEDNLTLCQESGDPWLIAQAIYEIAWVAEREGDLIEAKSSYESCVSLFRDQGDDIRACGILNANLGPLAFKIGDFARARELLEEGLNIARKTKHQLFLDIPLYLLGVLAVQDNDLPRAKEWFTECLRFEQENGETRQVARCLIGFAKIAVAKNCFEQAARLMGAAKKQIEANGAWWDDMDQAERDRLAKQLLTELNEETFTAAQADGRTMTIDEVLAFSL